VGLAAAAICLWIVFAIRRRRRMRLLKQSTVVPISTAPGLNRKALEDDIQSNIPPRSNSRFSGDVEMSQTSKSRLLVGTGSRPSTAQRGSSSGTRPHTSSSGYFDFAQDEPLSAFNPYEGYDVASTGYVPVTPSPAADPDPQTRGHETRGHEPSYSASFEPLLTGHQRQISLPAHIPPPSPTGSMPPTPPPRSPLRLSQNPASAIPGPVGTHSRDSSIYSDRDERLDPVLREWLQSGKTTSNASHGPRDEEDYSRPVLGVRSSFLLSFFPLSHP
jgi:hypothetical protein